MKFLYTFLIGYTLIGCLSEPRVPCVCQRNLQDCFAAYSNEVDMSRVDWSLACRKDFKVCESNYGINHD